jgi:transposase-like protein
MVAEVNQSYDSQWAAIGAVAQKLGIGSTETVGKWVRQAEVDTGQRSGTSCEDSAEIKRLSGLARKSFRGRQAACRWGWAGFSWVSMRWRRFSSSRRVNFQLKGLATAL